jgi:hypothetical protein
MEKKARIEHFDPFQCFGVVTIRADGAEVVRKVRKNPETRVLPEPNDRECGHDYLREGITRCLPGSLGRIEALREYYSLECLKIAQEPQSAFDEPEKSDYNKPRETKDSGLSATHQRQLLFLSRLNND